MVFLALLFFGVTIAIQENIKLFALEPPFAFENSANSFWHLGDHSFVVNDSFICLTTPNPNSHGRIWNNFPLKSAFTNSPVISTVNDYEWEFQFTYRISNQIVIDHHIDNTNNGNDGLAFWFTEKPLNETPLSETPLNKAEAEAEGVKANSVFGGPNVWNGLIIMIGCNSDSHDSFTHNRIYALLNDGTHTFDQLINSQKHISSKRECFHRNSDLKTKLSVIYNKSLQTLTLLRYSDVSKSFVNCFTLSHIDLPIGYHFGFSASTHTMTANYELHNTSLYFRSSSPNITLADYSTPKHTNILIIDETKNKTMKESKQFPNGSDYERIHKYIQNRKNDMNAVLRQFSVTNLMFANIVERLAMFPPGDYSSEFEELANLFERLKETVKSSQENESPLDVSAIRKKLEESHLNIEEITSVFIPLQQYVQTTLSTNVVTIHKYTNSAFWSFFALTQIAFVVGLVMWVRMNSEKRKWE